MYEYILQYFIFLPYYYYYYYFFFDKSVSILFMLEIGKISANGIDEDGKKLASIYQCDGNI